MNLVNNVSHGQTPEAHDDASALECCARSRTLEDKGEYDSAMELLSSFCSQVGEWPSMDGLSLDVQAQLLLRIGVVFGWAGSSKAIDGAGRFAQEMITCAAELSSEIGLRETNAEAHMELGWCLWRAGKLDDACKHYVKAISIFPETARRLKAKTILRLGIAYDGAGRHQDALTLLSAERPLFKSPEVADAVLMGYHNECALISKNLATPETREANLNRAISEYSTALYYGKRSGHKRHCAFIENNVANIHFLLNRPDKAFAHLERARRLFKSIGDIRGAAQVEETRAQALNDQGEYAEAERILSATIRTLEKAGEQSLLCESLVTYATALVKQGKAEEAARELRRAIEIAKPIGDRANEGRAWLVMIEESDTLGLPPEEVGAALTEAARLIRDSQDPKIKCRLLTRAVELATRKMSKDSHAPDPAEFAGLSLKEAVERFKAHYIEEALAAANGNKSEAARQLGLKPQGLHHLLNGTHKNITHHNFKTYRKSLAKRKPSDSGNVVDYVQFKSIKEAKEFIARRPNSAEIEMTDDSLTGKGVQEGDTLVVERGPVKDGDWIALESWSGVFMVGRLFNDRKGGVVWLDVANTQCDAHSVPQSAVRRFVGRVYGFYRPDDVNINQIVRPLA